MQREDEALKGNSLDIGIERCVVDNNVATLISHKLESKLGVSRFGVHVIFWEFARAFTSLIYLILSAPLTNAILVILLISNRVCKIWLSMNEAI